MSSNLVATRMTQDLISQCNYKIKQIISNIKQKHRLTLQYAAACHQQLELIQMYVNQDVVKVNIVFDSFWTLTFHFGGSSSNKSDREEINMVNNFDKYARELLDIKEGQCVKDNLEDYIEKNEKFLRLFYKEINDCIEYIILD